MPLSSCSDAAIKKRDDDRACEDEDKKSDERLEKRGVTRIATSGAPHGVEPEIAYSCVMSSTGGAFSDSDHTEVIAALEDTVLGGGLRRLFRQVDGIAITPADDASNSASVPEAFIGGSDIVRRALRVSFSVSGTSARDVERRLLAANMHEPPPHRSFGQCTYELDRDAAASELVDFALRGLRALATRPVDGRWNFAVMKSTSA